MTADRPTGALIALNGAPLGELPPGPAACGFDVSNDLSPRNQLTIAVVEQSPGRDRSGEGTQRTGMADAPFRVWLEVRSAHHVDGPALWATDGHPEPVVTFTGTVMGPHGDLALVVSAERREIAYARMEPEVPFRLEGPAEGLARWLPGGATQVRRLSEVEVKLLNSGHCVWRHVFVTGVREASKVDSPAGVRVAGRVFPVPDSPTSRAEWERLRMIGSSIWHKADARAVPQVLLLDAPLGEEDYQWADAAGVCLLQRVSPGVDPASWRVLFHHPSIVAWVGRKGSGPRDGTRPLIDGGNERRVG
jgi:hypothetical protein